MHMKLRNSTIKKRNENIELNKTNINALLENDKISRLTSDYASSNNNENKNRSSKNWPRGRS